MRQTLQRIFQIKVVLPHKILQIQQHQIVLIEAQMEVLKQIVVPNKIHLQ